MDTLFSRHRNTVVLIAVLFVQLVVLAAQVRRPDSEVPLIREWVMLVVSPPQRLVSGAFRFVVDGWNNYIDLRGARRNTASLEEQLSQERIHNRELQEQIGEMQRVQALSAFSETSASTLLVARIIGAGASDQSRVIFLNKGREDGVRTNMAVITAAGVVGKVKGVFTGSSQVLLITDEESGVGALLEKSRIHGVLHGQNSDECILRYVLNDEKVEVGEQLFTSGEDRVFPKGFPVGSVTSVEAGSDFKRIIVRPAARLNRLEDVFIVLRGREMALPGPMAPGIAPSGGTGQPGSTGPAGSAGATGNALPSGAALAGSKDKAADATERPGIPHGVRPETEADRLMEQVRQKAATGSVSKPAPTASGTPGATAPTKPPIAQRPPANPPVPNRPQP
jgi:rod shape-determining protein MreC